MTTPARSTEQAPGRFRRPPGMRRPGALAIDLILLVSVLLLLPQTLELGSGARRFPMIMLVVMAMLVLLDAAIEAFPAVRRRTGFLESDFVDVGASLPAPQLDDEPVEVQGGEHAHHRVLSIPQALGWLTALGAGMFFVGYVIMTPLFLVLFFLWARVPVKVALGITLVMTCLTYFVFNRYLGLR